jgi:hypothetical protein
MRTLVQKLDTFFHSANPVNTLISPHNNSLTALQLSAEDDASTLEEANNPHNECTSGNCICMWIASRASILKPSTKPLEALEVLVNEIHDAVSKTRNTMATGGDDTRGMTEDLEATAILEKVENLRQCVQYRLIMQSARSEETSTPPYLVHPKLLDKSKSSANLSSSHSYLTSLDYFKPTLPHTLSSASVNPALSKEAEPAFSYPDTSIPFSINHSMKSQTNLQNAMVTFESDAGALLGGARDHLFDDPGLNDEHDIVMADKLANISRSTSVLSEEIRQRISTHAALYHKELDKDMHTLQVPLTKAKAETIVQSKQTDKFLTNDPTIDVEYKYEIAGRLTKIGETLERVSSQMKDQVED